ncbi:MULTISPECIES: ABC transporter substrate-binding protein [Psychrilyobacter]|uniref:Myristoyl transferase n=1 Tax=Psychrilyobacter piezotolerans TaxID=2293438 RepID=A0ABX9KIZ7_9FUSO|nr:MULTISPECIES: ABC transporter substrate-binding protein [Psychrilyobacter]MCS5422216.1 ABC transporter substrate-binding protein [Psychrilyobacter sp. S5]NDI77136.1 ABC transporter substrate-binding protein [Psychrilyobacter piezotolerans]RDE64130.1 myristoyl transferase [Psychrilyobacter sp. S5]REI42222.1 myristoyl transferase [Psychrilyobacter piezotolerans]
MRAKNSRIINLFLAVILILLTACSSYKEPIKIGVNGWPPCELWYIAQEKGYFGDTPVEIVRFSTWSDNMDSLYVGNIDLMHSSYFNAVYYDSRGEAAKIILSANTTYGADGLVVKDYIEDIQELNGKKIAVEVGTDEQFLLHKVLKKGGLEDTDVTIISVSSEEGMRKFISGEVDATFTYEPFLSRAADEGDGKIMVTTSDTLNYTDTLVARDKVLQSRKKDYANIIRAWYRAQQFVKDNPQEAYQLMASKEGVTYDEFKSFYESFNFFTLEENKNIFSSEKFRDELKEIEVFLVEHKLISKDVDTDKLFDGNPVAQEAGGVDD